MNTKFQIKAYTSFPSYFEKLCEASDFTLNVDGTLGSEEEWSNLTELSSALDIDHMLDGRITIGDLCRVDPVYFNDSADITQVDESDYSKAMRKATKRAAWEREAPRRAEQELAIKRRERQAWLAEQLRDDAERLRKEAERLAKQNAEEMIWARKQAEKQLAEAAGRSAAAAARMAQITEHRKRDPYWNTRIYTRKEGEEPPALNYRRQSVDMSTNSKPAEYCAQTDGFEWPGR